MNYRYKSKRYTTPQIIKVGDIVEVVSKDVGIHGLDGFSHAHLRGTIIEIMPTFQMDNTFYIDAVKVEMLGGEWTTRATKLKLIRSARRQTSKTVLSRWFKYGVIKDSPALKVFSLRGDKAIWVTTHLYSPIAIIERKGIKLNLDTLNLRQVFEDFGRTHKISVSILKSPTNIALSHKRFDAPNIFWELEKPSPSSDLINAHNKKVIGKRVSSRYSYDYGGLTRANLNTAPQAPTWSLTDPPF